MPSRRFPRSPQATIFVLTTVILVSNLLAQSAKQASHPAIPGSDTGRSDNDRSDNDRRDNDHADTDRSDNDHEKDGDAWFFRGRVIRGKPSAELRRRAYQAKLQMRAQKAAALASARPNDVPPSGLWAPLGPVPLASDASGNGTQDYHQVSGRATAVAIDPADPTGNTVYIGGAQGGIWKSINAANSAAQSVTWTPVTDDQATLSIGALAIQPGNADPANTLILAATGEANDSADSYFGLGILRSTDAGGSWNLISNANSGSLSFSGLGGTRMAFDTASGQTNTVVAAMATSSEGLVDGAISAKTTRGLYTSLDAGQTWTYNALTDPGGATDATSATSVVYNATAGLFFAAIRYHGFYSSPDGVNWTRLATQPGGTALTTTACPPQSTSNGYACPIYRAEITVVPGRNEMYAWFIYFLSGSPADGGIWQSLDGGNTWNSISDTAISNCGDSTGCGVEQGDYNLELLAVPNASGTDLYAGSINLYKCSINAQNPACSSAPFLNLTHVYGCVPIAAPSHVHPDQHAVTFMIPTSGSDSGGGLMYFANDGGIYRALDGFAGLTTASCSGTNQFDDLNQNLGSMTQFVSFSQHPTDPNTLIGGTQDNGSPATNQATTATSWTNMLGGDGGYNAIDPNIPLNFYASNPDVPPDGLGIQLCSSGVSCTDSGFNFVVTSSAVGGDDGAFYFPYILDPQSSSALLVGTCRVWRGPRTGGAYTVLSPNFDTLGSGTCSGSEVNLVRALAAGGPTDNNGSLVVYATTSGLGPLDGSSPTGGQVWVTTNATAGPTSFANVTANGPQGSINPNQFPVSDVAMDSSDPTGATAYVTVMGFTGGPGHVWKTTNFGGSWTDFTANLPDAPTNAPVVDSTNGQVYVGTDVGVFVSSTSSANWTELGPNPTTDLAGFLPNVAVTALGLFNSGGEELLRASTYGRGVWQFPVHAESDFTLAISNSPLIAFPNQAVSFNGTLGSVNGYESPVTLTCVAVPPGPLPSTCNIPQSPLTPGSNATFTVIVSGAVGTYNFNVQAVGSDPNQTTHIVSVTLNVVSFALTAPSPSMVTVPRGTTSSLVSFQISASGSFSQSVNVSCNPAIANATCTLTPGTTVNPTASSPVNMTASVAVPTATAPNDYTVTLQASTQGAPAALSTDFTLNVTTNPDFVLSEPSPFPEVNAGSTGTNGPISITSQDGFSGTVTLACPTTFGPNSCSINPTSVSSFPATPTLTINGTSFIAGSYSLAITGTSGSDVHTINVPFNVGDYSLTDNSPQPVTVAPAGQASIGISLTSISFYAGNVIASCSLSPSAPSGTICTLSPPNPIVVTADATITLTATVNIPNNAPDGNFNVTVNTQDSTGAPSHSITVAVAISQDFQLISFTPSETVNAPGQETGPYNFNIQPVGGAFNSAVTVACASGLPVGAQCIFDPPSPQTPGASVVQVVLNISTTGPLVTTTSAQDRFLFYTLGLVLPAITILCSASRGGPRNRKLSRSVSVVTLFLLTLALISCAGVSNGGGSGTPTPPGTYTITVTGTSPGTPPDPGQTTTVTLVVN
jgi:hypothetical protein